MLDFLLRLLRAARSRTGASATAPAGLAEVRELDPAKVGSLELNYAPEPDGAPDAGEILWAWVPYAEHDGRGKDRPLLVVAARDAEQVFAVKLTSKPHDGQRDFLSIGSGPWDPQRRPSWVDLDQLYLVPARGVRREGATLERAVFGRVAAALSTRYGWRVVDR